MEEIITALCFSTDAENLKNMSTWENENTVQLVSGKFFYLWNKIYHVPFKKYFTLT